MKAFLRGGIAVLSLLLLTAAGLLSAGPPPPGINPTVTAELNAPCPPGVDARSSDLCAQWKAADAAAASAYWTQGSFWLGVGGLAVGGLTLVAAAAAAYFAMRAAQETKRTADALRPHLYVSLLDSTLGSYLAGNAHAPKFKFQIINAGGGPGRIVQSDICLRVAHESGGHGQDIGARIKRIVFPAGAIEEFEVEATEYIAPIAADLNHYFRKNNPMVGTASHIRYVDAVGNEHSSSENWRIFDKRMGSDIVKSEALGPNHYS